MYFLIICWEIGVLGIIIRALILKCLEWDTLAYATMQILLNLINYITGEEELQKFRYGGIFCKLFVISHMFVAERAWESK